ncbi:MAG: hypothetical protein IJ532_00055 [Alphaproteobacteria bacterium]|nr:hypothetical protein [Alphaproteobacteria bacterium]
MKTLYDIDEKTHIDEFGVDHSKLSDSANDLVADAKGIYKGYNNPTGNCYDMMKSYYNPYKKDER